jgi:hypothetical protein
MVAPRKIGKGALVTVGVATPSIAWLEGENVAPTRTNQHLSFKEEVPIFDWGVERDVNRRMPGTQPRNPRAVEDRVKQDSTIGTGAPRRGWCC